jgi:lysophospholipase L1-like esterase
VVEAQSVRWGLGRKLGLALGSALATLFAVEFGARLWLGDEFRAGERVGASWQVLARFDPQLGWANRSDTLGHVFADELDYRARTNSQGLREQEFELRKRAGTRRALILGDSMAWGWGVDDGQRFSDLIGAKLSPGIQVLNLAVPGYGTDQQAWSLASRGESFEPDAVVVVFVLNDVLESDAGQVYGMHKPRFVLEGEDWSVVGRPVVDPRGAWSRWSAERWTELGSHSALRALLHRPQLRPTLTVEDEQRIRPYRPEFQAKVRAVAERMLDPGTPARHALAAMCAWCQARSVPLVVLVLPHKHDQYLYEPLCERPDFDGTTIVTKTLARAGLELGFPVLNVDRAMWEASGRGERLHCGDGHLNEAGNRLVARELGPFLEALLAPVR